MHHRYLSSLLLIFILYKQTDSKGANVYDTYNADECQRVRRSWSSLKDDEKQLYIDGLMELRKHGGGDVFNDEFIAIGSVHEDGYGGENHFASSYLFWHGYMLWELESRIRNLGGRYKCFAMPYWQFATGEAPGAIFGDILGGRGDPNNYWNVNEFSWDYTKDEFWVPAHCDAEGDHYPICSLKRSTQDINQPTPEEMAEGIIDNPIFADFDRWYSHNVNLPHNFLIDTEYLRLPVVTQYDPIWYLFHSMVSYHQAIWTDCNDYDLIDPDDLDHHPEAYQGFCDSECGPNSPGLDDKMYYGGTLQDHDWALIHNEKLTVRKSYHLNKWNIIYDLGNGDGFFSQSGLKDYCKGKLNPEWFMYNENNQNGEYYQKKQQIEGGNNGDDKVLDSVQFSVFSEDVVSDQLAIAALIVVVGVSIACLVLAFMFNGKREIKMKSNSKGIGYGSV